MTPADVAPYAQSGVVDVVAIAGLAFGIVQYFKSGLDVVIDPVRHQALHDFAARLCVVTLALGGSLLAQAARSSGLGSWQDVYTVLFSTVAAVIGAEGIYKLQAGGTPATPTPSQVGRMLTTLRRAGVEEDPLPPAPPASTSHTPPAPPTES